MLIAAFTGYAEVWPQANGYPAAPPRLPQATTRTPAPRFSVEATGTALRVRVYAGAARLRNLSGPARKTIVVTAGFESTVEGPRPPTPPHRFTPPVRPFWK